MLAGAGRCSCGQSRWEAGIKADERTYWVLSCRIVPPAQSPQRRHHGARAPPPREQTWRRVSPVYKGHHCGDIEATRQCLMATLTLGHPLCRHFSLGSTYDGERASGWSICPRVRVGSPRTCVLARSPASLDASPDHEMLGQWAPSPTYLTFHQGNGTIITS